jgi:hypothetical protein
MSGARSLHRRFKSRLWILAGQQGANTRILAQSRQGPAAETVRWMIQAGHLSKYNPGMR